MGAVVPLGVQPDFGGCLVWKFTTREPTMIPAVYKEEHWFLVHRGGRDFEMWEDPFEHSFDKVWRSHLRYDPEADRIVFRGTMAFPKRQSFEGADRALHKFGATIRTVMGDHEYALGVDIEGLEVTEGEESEWDLL